MHFKLNQYKVEQEFCINKAKPELQCHGKCHLKKELEKSDTADLKLTSIGKKIDIAMSANIEFAILIVIAVKSNKTICYREYGLAEPCMEIFVPPPILLFFNQCQLISRITKIK